MTWGVLFSVRQKLKGSLWVVPMAGGVTGILLSLGHGWIEKIGSPDGWQYSSSTAIAVLTTVVGATVGLIGFVVTVTILVVQMATGTFSARYMRIWYRDPVLKLVLAVLVGTLTYSYVLLRHVETDQVPHIGVTLAGLFLGTGVVLFLVFLDRVVHRLRPVKVAALVARAGRASVAGAAAAAAPTNPAQVDATLAALAGVEPATVVCSSRPGAIQALDATGLVDWASKHDCTLIFLHATGDFVTSGSGLIEVYGSEELPVLAERQLGGMVALGTERTIDQDPAFAVRIMVDVAIRALSPAVNDPTTAVQVLNHLEDTVAELGTTPGLDGRVALRDDAGTPRLVMPARRWEEFLALATTEIRQFGGTSIQVMRRLRAMLDALEESVLPEYRPAVEDEIARLDATVAENWGSSVDLDRASHADRQGIGGPPQLHAHVASTSVSAADD
jgi:uncharacterized membrane protein